jgi:hypothetical protein
MNREEFEASLKCEEPPSWRIASKTEPGFKNTFPTEKETFDVWHAMFHAHRKLRK